MTTLDPTPPSWDEEAIQKLFVEPRTSHTWADEPVTDEQLRQIWEALRWGPTTINAQPLHIVWVRTPEGRQRLLPFMWDGNHDQFLQAKASAILALDKRFVGDLDDLYPNIPGIRSHLEPQTERLHWMATLSAHMQAGYFVLAARALGLGVGPMEGFNRLELDDEYFPDGRYESFLVINVGTPGSDAWVERGPRRGPDDVMEWT